MNPNDLKCRAKDLNGNVVEGWYVGGDSKHFILSLDNSIYTYPCADMSFSGHHFAIDPATLELCSEPVLKVKP